MVGDVNAFLCHDEEGGEAEDDEKAVKKRSNKKCFELSVRKKSYEEFPQAYKIIIN